MAAEITQTTETDIPLGIVSETESVITTDTISLSPSSPSVSSTQYSACEESQAVLHGNDPMVLCMIRRKRASSLIVYRANIISRTESGGHILTTFHPTKPIDIFWLKLSARDLRLHRESGKMDDRVELTQIERMIAYGVNCRRVGGGKKEKKSHKWSVSLQQKKNKIKARWAMRKSNNGGGNTAAVVADQNALSPPQSVTPKTQDVAIEEVSDHDTDAKMNDASATPVDAVAADGQQNECVDSFLVSFNALKAMQLTLRMDASDNIPHLYGSLHIDDQEIECKLKEIWVTMKKVKNLKIEKVDYVTLCAVRCDNDEQVEHIMKKDGK
eukprot:CAMPEP_0202713552 /NCGR_PEP_ID=MMETSP1385-20130828/55960_1 /ASSEMBLY_ACC=CAM_ASM_000861 /TAXON_ID=933848 /ORGANISM="Elphidium margaritaceum" /LENGTH=326 /DNA_ID=CAMNT_0049373941 /DNA_START=35 /DNA_END=1015 /DNA_ORIENTATION=-